MRSTLNATGTAHSMITPVAPSVTIVCWTTVRPSSWRMTTAFASERSSCWSHCSYWTSTSRHSELHGLPMEAALRSVLSMCALRSFFGHFMSFVGRDSWSSLATIVGDHRSAARGDSLPAPSSSLAPHQCDPPCEPETRTLSACGWIVLDTEYPLIELVASHQAGIVGEPFGGDLSILTFQNDNFVAAKLRS